MKKVFYDYQLTKDLNEHGFEASPKNSFNSVNDAIAHSIRHGDNLIPEHEKEVELTIYKIEIIKTVKLKRNTVIEATNDKN